jgi:hypothetical protein
LSTNEAHAEFYLHPQRVEWASLGQWLEESGRIPGVPGVVVFGLVLSILLSRNVRRLTICRPQFIADPLWLREEDIGGLNGFMELARRLAVQFGPPKAELKKEPAADEIGTACCNEPRRTLYNLMARVVRESEPEIFRSYEEQCAGSILAETDIRDPEALVQQLQETVKKVDAYRNALNPKPAEGIQKLADDIRKTARPLLFEMALHLSPASRLILEHWKEETADRLDLLARLTQDLRTIINSFELSANEPDIATKIAREFSTEVLWLRNRERLATELKDLFRPPTRPSQLLFRNAESASEGRVTQQKHRPDALSDSELTEFLRTVMLTVLDEWNAQLARADVSAHNGPLQSEGAIKKDTHD